MEVTFDVLVFRIGKTHAEEVRANGIWSGQYKGRFNLATYDGTTFILKSWAI